MKNNFHVIPPSIKRFHTPAKSADNKCLFPFKAS